MSSEDLAICGLDCAACGYREPTGCPGCVAARGKLFWGECDMAGCCIGKGLDHCGQCPSFACEDLTAAAHDPEHGDAEGSRIINLRRRLAQTGHEA